MYSPFSLFSMGPHLGHFCAFWVRFKFVFFLISNFVFFWPHLGLFLPFYALRGYFEARVQVQQLYWDLFK